MTHLDAESLLALHEGDLTPTAQAKADAHLAHCGRCQAERRAWLELAAAIAAPEPGLGQRDLVVRLGQRRGRHRFSVHRWLLPGGLVTGMAAATLVWVVTARLPVDEAKSKQVMTGFRAKGVRQAATEWIGLAPYRVDQRGDLHPLGAGSTGVLFCDDAVAFTYWNDDNPETGSEAQKYLMVFAVDEDKRVYWYYPAHQDEAQNPHSIRIDRGVREEPLPHQVAHDLRPGQLTLYGLFSNEPHDVKSIEALIADAQVGALLPLENTIQQRTKVRTREGLQ